MIRQILIAIVLGSLLQASYGQKTMPIGSSSMMPTIHKDELIDINLMAYAQRKPQRWDVITYWSETKKFFLTHRIVGLPGDVIAYDKDKHLQINDVVVQSYQTDYASADGDKSIQILAEYWEGERHLIQLIPKRPAYAPNGVERFPHQDLCINKDGGFRCTVPTGTYFVMGDSRDNALDSRYLGFVPEAMIGGKVEGIHKNESEE